LCSSITLRLVQAKRAARRSRAEIELGLRVARVALRRVPPSRAGVLACRPDSEELHVSGDALAVVREFWRIQDEGDYTRLVPLFSEDAVLEDPVYGTMRGREAIAAFMTRMVSEMRARKTRFRALEIAAAGDVAWAQWVAETPAGEIHGVGVYRTRDGEMTYYRDYMNAPASKR
jgi:limonene-1,2-epoxide hydrolase